VTAPSPTPPPGGISLPSLHGRIVYAASVPGSPGLRERLFVYDLDDETIAPGPRTPTIDELADVDGDRLVMVGDGEEGERVAYVVPDLGANRTAREVARGRVVEPSPDGRFLLIVNDRPRGCVGPGYELQQKELLPNVRFAAEASSRDGCGTVISAATTSTRAAFTVIDRRDRATVVLGPGVGAGGDLRFAPAFEGLAVMSVSPTGSFLFTDAPTPADARVPPTGPLLVWQGHGQPRTVAEGFRATRVLSWMPGGGIAVVNGTLEGQRAMWLVNMATGTTVPILPSNRFDLGTAFSGATFDRAGNAFGASAGVIVVSGRSGTFPLPFPPDAPTPLGPIVWLP